MKSFYRISAAVFTAILIIFVAANLYLQNAAQPASGRPWRVEVNRLALQMENGEKAELSNCAYVTKITAFSDEPQGFYQADNDNVIREINGELYRFDYVQT